VPTGRNDGVGFGWGAYRNNFGGVRVKSTTNKCVSLSHENARYLDGIAKGHKSAAVNSALTWYRGQGVEIHELLANIEGLQNVIAQLYQQELEVSPAGPEVAPLGGGLRAIIARIWPFHI